MMWNKKIQAGALQFVLFIGAIIAVLLMCFVLISYTHNLFHKKTDMTVAVIQQTDYGMNYSLGKEMAVGSSVTISPDNEIDIPIVVKKEYWGIFEKRSATATHETIVFTKTALVGNNDREIVSALYLKNNQRPMVIAGNAKITGNTFLPQQGIRMGNIAGNSYYRDRLVYGTENPSSSTLPKINPEVINQIKKLMEGSFDMDDQIVLRADTEVKNSFESPTLFIADHTVRLEAISLSGNIMVYAAQKIIVEPTALLRDVVLVAPEIVIKDRVKGYFQALASKKIQVGKYCELAYPSALVLQNSSPKKDVKGKNVPSIFVDSNSEIRGLLLYLEESEHQYYLPQIRVMDNALVQGQIYCTKNLELKGIVLGNVTTNAFIALENGSIYQNHLYNGQINSLQLSKKYVGLSMADQPNQNIMKWLY